jgi:hypothetical protein
MATFTFGEDECWNRAAARLRQLRLAGLEDHTLMEGKMIVNSACPRRALRVLRDVSRWKERQPQMAVHTAVASRESEQESSVDFLPEVCGSDA